MALRSYIIQIVDPFTYFRVVISLCRSSTGNSMIRTSFQKF